LEFRSLLRLKEILRSHAMPPLPAELLSAIESKTYLKPRWWESGLQRHWAPTALGFAAALGAWFLFHAANASAPRMPQPLPVAQAPALPPHYQRPAAGRVALHRADPSEPTSDPQ
jgi:hypothetical protein